ncbi:hypothetical protein [Chitinimonas sp. BJB300]|uniref:hypothetical protein n=1 Tax=Chitinimonas sp. BJB300 TaxID=1559339 RepID=UPI000C0EBC78|nr:hypothetical protein [Chitinimonas sp. BJB300]PHV11784.1 hypothetical protein CSQ89_09095 [Chitinimonas sp. BJB300]TSJ91217.1 hypothetical protein FG002_002680 [Chitinimonas sp. BJB300]
MSVSASRLCVGLLGLFVSVSSLAEAKSDFRFMMSLGYTGGGDKVLRASIFDVSTGNLIDETDIKAGERYQLNMGAYWKMSASPISAQLTYGYHADSAGKGAPDKITFGRYPIELLAHYHINDTFFFGGGVRKATRNNLTYYVKGVKTSFRHESNTGGVVELGWQAVPDLMFTLRAVSERYKEPVSGKSYSGKHVGLFGTYVF